MKKLEFKTDTGTYLIVEDINEDRLEVPSEFDENLDNRIDFYDKICSLDDITEEIASDIMGRFRRYGEFHLIDKTGRVFIVGTYMCKPIEALYSMVRSLGMFIYEDEVEVEYIDKDLLDKTEEELRLPYTQPSDEHIEKMKKLYSIYKRPKSKTFFNAIIYKKTNL